MTEDQIKAIAEEYAKTLLNEYSTGVDKDDIKCLAFDLEQFLTFISSRYGIVEREKVMEKYNAIMFLNQVGCQDRLDLIEDLFGTSMFNQNEE